MRKYNYLKWPCCLLSVLFFGAACHDDKGNYDYRPINEIEISGIKEEYEMKLGERITIIPEIKQTIPVSEEGLGYLWLKVGFETAMDWSFDTVYREKAMDNIIPALNAGAHNMVFQVKDNNTGVTYFSETFKITIQKDIGTGWLMLFENDGKADLRFLNYYNKLLSMREVDLSVLPELGKPKDIVTYNDWNSPAPAERGYSVTIVSETGFYRLKRDDFSYKDTYGWKYHVNGDLTGFHPESVIAPTDKSRWNAMMTDQTGNYMYFERGTIYSQGWTVGLYCNKYQGEDTTLDKLFKPAEKYGYAAGIAVFFDPQTKSFVYKRSLSNYCTEYTTEPEQFRLKNTPYDDPYYVLLRGGSNPLATAVVKNTQTNTIDLLSWTALTGAYDYKQRLWPTTEKGEVLPNIQNAKQSLCLKSENS